ncbi:ATPase, T2SS/T4P/T4SS family [Mycoplasma sp. P36-A1]|uniref:ATPase, T2SS/T4P/T4SS family n=1 Tax=Mycoplasma sp. P36-A1 TaxID=3252900 RepID=UPI003C2B7471
MNKIFNLIITTAIKTNSSDIHFEENSNNTDILFRQYGSIKKGTSLENTKGNIINYIVYKANLDVLNNYNLNTGMIHYEYENRIINLRISLISNNMQRSIVIRVINNHKKILINKLCFLKNNSDNIKKIIYMDSGLILICGKTGSGKTTTLYSLIEELKKSKRVVTVENPIERNIDGITQIDLSKKKISSSIALMQILRHDPDVIVYGEIRNQDELKNVVHAALSGHLVISTMHAINSKHVISKIKSLEIPADEIYAVLNLILYQQIFYTKNNNPTIVLEKIEANEIEKILNNEIVNIASIQDQISHYIKRGDLYKGK